MLTEQMEIMDGHVYAVARDANNVIKRKLAKDPTIPGIYTVQAGKLIKTGTATVVKITGGVVSGTVSNLVTGLGSILGL
jgi:hypothetical protein